MSDAELHVMIIDDNPAIHQDFIKVLTTATANSEIDDLGQQLFDDELDLANPHQVDTDIALPRFIFDTAYQGKEGVEAIKRSLKQGIRYALAFVDIQMPPGWDGIETIKHMWGVDPDIQVVICTAYSDYTWEETVKELGIGDNYLILKKPFDLTAVRQLACALTRKWILAEAAKRTTERLQETIEQKTESLQQYVKERAKLARQLEYQASHDILTGLPNRTLLMDRIQHQIESSARYNRKFGVLFFDLDRFKLINDSLTHEAGDNLLKLVARRWSDLLRKEDTIARIGGDEFVIIIPNVTADESIITVVDKIIQSLNTTFRIAERDVAISTSIGISVYPKDGTTVNALLKNADLAMYLAKGRGGNQFQFYNEDLNDHADKTLKLEMELRQALINNEFIIYYQPQFDMENKCLLSAEALIRWQHPERGLLLPLDFIPAAERCGLIVPMGEWLIDQVCQQIKKWHDKGLPWARIAVNIATQQLKQVNFDKVVKNILDRHQIDPQFLELEITENVVITNVDVFRMINQLKDIGVKIVLDDFGTGNSSLNYLKHLNIDRLKIDQSYIKNITSSRSDEVIIEAIIAMARSFNFKVLAEGVETSTQMNYLKATHCDEVQGFLFSKPILAQELEQFLK